jgi:colanic acid biosynthesis glycosyl transferase WcaI
LARIATKYETWALKKYDKISTISENMMLKLAEKNVPKERLYEFRNWSDTQNIFPLIAISPLKDELKITQKYVVLYSGNMANKQGLDILPKIAQNLSHREDLAFLLCGDGPMRSELILQCAELKNIIFAPLQPTNRLNDLMGIADIHILPQIAEASDLVLPSKLTNMLASGRPIVATSPPNTALSNEIVNAGIVVPPGDDKGASNAIETLLNDAKMRVKFGKTARKKAEENWEMNAILTRLSRQIGSLVDIK